MADRFQGHSGGMSGPGTLHRQITPHNDNVVDPLPRALWCNSAGSLVLEDATGTALTYNVQAGQVIPFRAVKVRATGTTATVFGWE